MNNELRYTYHFHQEYLLHLDVPVIQRFLSFLVIQEILKRKNTTLLNEGILKISLPCRPIFPGMPGKPFSPRKPGYPSRPKQMSESYTSHFNK